MDVESSRVLNLHSGFLEKLAGHEIITKVDAIKRFKIEGLQGGNNVSVAALEKLRDYANKGQGYVISDIQERTTGDGVYKSLIFMRRSILSSGKSIKDVLPYGMMVGVLVFLPETAGILDDIPMVISTSKKPMTICIIHQLAKNLHLDLDSDSYDSFYYCGSSAYGKNLLRINDHLPSIPPKIRLSVGDLAYYAASSLHTAATTYIRLFDNLPAGFSPRSHLYKVVGILDMPTFKDVVKTKTKSCDEQFYYDDVKNVMIRDGVFSADHQYTAVILWRGWASTYMEMLSQEQQSQLQSQNAFAGDLGIHKFTVASKFDEGQVYVQYKFITPGMLARGAAQRSGSHQGGNLYPSLNLESLPKKV
nr:non-structural protein [Homalodisca vitripennis reovirus]